MTATQVFTRFLKENGLFSYYDKIIFKTFKNIIRCQYIPPKKNLDIKNAVDEILKAYKYNLSGIFYVISLPDDISRNRMILSSKFYSFLKNNIKSNYRKIMIPDVMAEKDRYGYRNGYHKLDFELKEENVREI